VVTGGYGLQWPYVLIFYNTVTGSNNKDFLLFREILVHSSIHIDWLEYLPRLRVSHKGNQTENVHRHVYRYIFIIENKFIFVIASWFDLLILKLSQIFLKEFIDLEKIRISLTFAFTALYLIHRF